MGAGAWVVLGTLTMNDNARIGNNETRGANGMNGEVVLESSGTLRMRGNSRIHDNVCRFASNSPTVSPTARTSCGVKSFGEININGGLIYGGNHPVEDERNRAANGFNALSIHVSGTVNLPGQIINTSGLITNTVGVQNGVVFNGL